MNTEKINAAFSACVAWSKAHPAYVQWGVCFLAGFLVAKCVF